MPTSTADSRLFRQQLLRPQHARPADLVRSMGAVQAQDYRGGLWALGTRLRAATETSIEQAIAARTIVRSWPMRGTLHFVPAEDLAWMVERLAPRMIARAAGRYRQLGLDEAVFRRSRTLLVRALRGGRALTRPDTYAALERGGVSTEGQRGIHIVAHLAQQGVVCFGPRDGAQPTFVLLDEWVPAPRRPSREEALAILAERYFGSHGPATLVDFAWWTGLTMKEAQAAVGEAGTRIVQDGQGCFVSSATRRPSRVSAPLALLLPPWDEYVIAYRDRSHVLDERRARDAMLGTIGRSLVVMDGRARGSWRRTLTTSAVRVHLELWGRVSSAERRALEGAVDRYGRFLGREARLEPS